MNHHDGAPRILLAAAPEPCEALCKALGTAYRLSAAHTLAEATIRLEPSARFELILCDLNFDESRMFDLLRYVKAEPRTRAIGFLAAKMSGLPLTGTFRQSIEIACAALGAERFIEYSEWERKEGTALAQARLRVTIERILLG